MGCLSLEIVGFYVWEYGCEFLSVFVDIFDYIFKLVELQVLQSFISKVNKPVCQIGTSSVFVDAFVQLIKYDTLQNCIENIPKHPKNNPKRSNRPLRSQHISSIIRILLNKSYSDHDEKFEDIDNSNNCPQVGEIEPVVIQFSAFVFLIDYMSDLLVDSFIFSGKFCIYHCLDIG